MFKFLLFCSECISIAEKKKHKEKKIDTWCYSQNGGNSI